MKKKLAKSIFRRFWAALGALLALFWAADGAQAKRLLDDLDLSGGTWEMVGVKLYNHKMTPIQEELGTFVMQNVSVLKKMQSKWDFAPFFEDYCDYHYVLKFYKNKQLVKTLKVNLVCGYISEGLLSYSFDPTLFTEHRAHYGRLPWSRVYFSNLERLRFAIKKLQNTPDVYLYQDVKPFAHDGYFVVGVDGLKWNAKRDSLRSAVAQKIEALAGDKNVYIEPFVFFMNEKQELSFRFNVYCTRETAERYAVKDPRNITASWRSHFDDLNDETENDKTIMLVVVGVNEEKYRRIVN